jgi:hypothetical protein
MKLETMKQAEEWRHCLCFATQVTSFQLDGLTYGTTTIRHTGQVTTHYMIYHSFYLFLGNSEGSKKLPGDGRLLPKYVGASIWNKGVVKSVRIVSHFYYV